MKARALRFVAPRRVEIAEIDVSLPAAGEVLVRTCRSGISGGTELLAYRGELDARTARDDTIAALGGAFDYPFAYGYSCVGTVSASRADGVPEGATVFAFHPHQDVFTAPIGDIVTVEGIEDRIATMFPLVETALQVALDAGPVLGEPTVVLGLGPVGMLSAVLLQRAGSDVIGVDVRHDRREVARRFGVRAIDAADVEAAVHERTSGDGVPLVVEATGHPPVLAGALDLLAHEGEVLVCSWYGTKEVSLPLGGAFHRRRLRVRSTQVSTIPANLAGRWDIRRRRREAAELMTELPLGLLPSHEVPFERAAEAYTALDHGDDGLMHAVLTY